MNAPRCCQPATSDRRRATARVLLTASLLSSVVLAAACKKAGATNPGSVPSSVTVSPSNITLDPGATTKLTAEVRDAASGLVPDVAVQWSAAPAGIVSVQADGTVTALAAGDAVVTATAEGKQGSASVRVRNVFDIDVRGVPAFVTADYIDLASVRRISLFRSGIGHDYSDSAESCRSMKHYFQPRTGIDWSSVTISSPAAGTVANRRSETTFGEQVEIRPAAFPAFSVIIFHVTPDTGIAVGVTVAAGQRLGHHVGAQTMSDVAIRVETPTGPRLVSYFDAMNEATFARYLARGAGSRASLVISRGARDASPLSCQGEMFASPGALENWLELN